MSPTTETLLDALTACETRVWQALVAGDAAADAAALSECFWGVYSDGFATKSGHVAQLAEGPSIARFALSDLRARDLGADHALLSYRADFQRIGTGASEAMYVSSIWQRRGARGWVNIFSQDTPATA